MNSKTMICLLVSIVVLSACAPPVTSEPAAPTTTEEPKTNESPAAPTETPTATEEPKSPGYPLSNRTGITDVDEVLAAVESGDAQSLRDLVRFTTVGCTTGEGVGGLPKCREGEAEGALVNVLPLLGPEGSFIYESDLSNFLPIKALEIYTVYSVSDSAYSEEAYPAGEYAAIFATVEKQIYIVYQIRKGIVRVDTVFSPSSLGTVIKRDALELILAPK